MYDQNLQLHVAEEGSTEDILYFGSKTSDFLSSRIEFDNKNAYSFSLKPNRENKFYFEFENTAFNKAVYEKSGWIYKEWGSDNNESTLNTRRDSVSKYVAKYMESFRVFHFHDSSKTSRMRKPANIGDNSFFREDVSNLPAYLYWMQEVHPKDFRKIEYIITSVAPYFDGFNLHSDRINPEMIRLEWKEKRSDAYFNAQHLSDGTLRFIALATLLLQPKAPQVIIIDEPELGLHPFAVNMLAALIKKLL
ncbi:MAG: AAA family ATPase [Bacteroides sp.]|nr:AAA family ATPase [Bacteroides sp.]